MAEYEARISELEYQVEQLIEILQTQVEITADLKDIVMDGVSTTDRTVGEMSLMLFSIGSHLGLSDEDLGLTTLLDG